MTLSVTRMYGTADDSARAPVSWDQHIMRLAADDRISDAQAHQAMMQMVYAAMTPESDCAQIIATLDALMDAHANSSIGARVLRAAKSVGGVFCGGLALIVGVSMLLKYKIRRDFFMHVAYLESKGCTVAMQYDAEYPHLDLHVPWGMFQPPEFKRALQFVKQWEQVGESPVTYLLGMLYGGLLTWTCADTSIKVWYERHRQQGERRRIIGRLVLLRQALLMKNKEGNNE